VLLKESVIQIIEESLKTISHYDESLPIKIEYARDEKFGDYACTIAMDKAWREQFSAHNPEYKNPLKLAERIAGAVRKHPDFNQFFEYVEVVKPGFINIRIAPSLLFKYTLRALEEREKFGFTSKNSPRSIIFEYVSANPTGPLNVVSARAAALGDCCCNLLEAAGENVTREYYVNDYGNQVNLLGWSCLLRFMESKGVPVKFSEKDSQGNSSYSSGEGIPFPAEGYHGEYLSDIANEILEKFPETKPENKLISHFKEISKRTDFPEEELFQIQDAAAAADTFGRKATEYFLNTHKRDLENFRVSFDSFFSEKSLHDAGSVLRIREKLKRYIYKEDEKELFKSTDFGDDKDRVIMRSDGRPTYLLADIAYHNTKIERNFSQIYNIWGPDHHGYIRRLAGAMEALGFNPEQFRVLIAQQVNLLENGKPIVMSKRTGKFITMKTLVEEIPVDVIRYFFVMRAFESHLDFDFSEARDTSEKNPYYYVAYAHARIRSIFRKAGEIGLIRSDLADRQKTSEELSSAEMPEMTEERRRLLWLIARFPEEVRDAADSLEPQRIINYLYTLASSLSRFYAPQENRVISQEPKTAASLLSALDAVAYCLKTGLKLLGMEAPEKMVREVDLNS